MSTTARLILNGKSASAPGVREAVEALQSAGHDIEVRTTREQGDAARFAAEAEAEGVPRVVAGGGDGTVSEVVNGLLGATEKPTACLGILPLGTANDFATGCDVPANDPEAALRLALEGDAVAIDVAKGDDRFFINVASVGFPAEVTAETDPRLKKILGGMAYPLTGLFKMGAMTPYEGAARGPDWDASGRVTLGAVANGRLAGGGFAVAPKAVLNDGLLDLAYIREAPTDQLSRVLQELTNFGDPANEIAVYRQSPWVEFELTEPRQFNLDGEPVSADHMRFEVLPGVLHAVLGPRAPLV